MSYKLKHIITSVLLCILVSSCISSEETNYLQAYDMQYKAQPYEDYKLVPGDLISCIISSGDKEFAQNFDGLITDSQNSIVTFSVYEDGTIHIPYFGPITVAGLTVQEAELKIMEDMQQSIIDVQIHISLVSNNFYILSNGQKGSFLVYKDRLTIYQALAISGQTADNMDLSQVKIIRKNHKGETQVKDFDLRTQDVIQSEYYYIYPNDIIYFPTNKNSFFNITSVGSFITAITVPLSFLIFVSTYNFK